MTDMHAIPPRRLLLDSIIFDLQRGGGISRYWYELLANLIRRRPDWRLVLWANQRTDNPLLTQLRQQMSGSDWVEARSLEPGFLGRYRPARIDPTFGNITLFHSSYYRLPAPSLPAVTTVHDFTYERFGSPLPAWIHHRQKAAAVRGSREIICVSEATRKDLLTFFPDLPAERCHVVHHGLSPIFHERREGLSAGADGRYVLFVGQRGSYKNFHLAVAATAASAGLQLFIAGGGALSAEEAASLERLLPGRHRHFGQVTDDELRELYQAALALTYLSSYEGFGLPPLEAMACGCPVIAMNASSVPEVVGEAAILLDRAEPRPVIEAIAAVSNSERRRSMIDAGLKQASRFSWDRAVDQTLAVYERAIRTRE